MERLTLTHQPIMNGKCKIWDTEKKCWYKPTYQKANSKNEYFEELLISMSGEICLRRFTIGEKEIEFQTFPNADDKKEQRFLPFYYTGFKDSEDSKIYFGDILQHDGGYYVVSLNLGTIYGDISDSEKYNLPVTNFCNSRLIGQVVEKTT